MSTFDAIIPAGGEIDEAFAAIVGTKNKALIQIEGKTVLESIIASLRDSGHVRRIAMIGPDEVRSSEAAKMVDYSLSPADTGPDNILKGLETLAGQADPPKKVLVVTSDLPFLSAEIVNRFIELSPEDVDICLPLVSKSEYQTRFPGSTSTFIPLRGGSWTAGCMYILDVDALRRAKPHIDRIFAVRKSKIGMAKLLGPTFLYKFLRKTLTVADLERKIAEMVGCTGRAVFGSPAELAFDLDYLDDYEYAMKHLEASR